MLLPSMLKELVIGTSIKIGWFLHTPFPSSEIYRILPVRREVLHGILQCDLLGFHTYDYARHFLSSCTRILGLSTVPNGVEFEGRLINVGIFPIGIDPEKFSLELKKETIQDRIQSLKDRFGDTKIVVSVDRLDYIKGLPQKLHALDIFLEKHPEFQGKVILIQVAVPSRTDVEEYQNLRSTVNELVGRINGKYGTVDFTPIHFMNKSVNFQELVALYAVADACLVSSTRDGMNLVSYEYIVCQQKNHGVLILSEFAGAAQSLNGSIIVNPWNTEELANALHDALTMSEEQRKTNHQKLYRYCTKFTASYWGQSFVKELVRVSKQYDVVSALPRLKIDFVMDKFKKSKQKKLLFLDYDGTLTATHKIPEFARPSPSIIQKLKALSALPDTYVYILSGRSRLHLEKWFGDCGVGLSAEHGCFYKHPKKLSDSQQFAAEPDSDGWFCLTNQMDTSWKSIIRPLFDHYTARTPGSFIEEKEVNMTWHYRNTDPEFGVWQASELQVNLEKILSHMALSIVLGNKTLELRPSSSDKATAAKAILKDIQGDSESVDFLLCIGDGRTDEVVFSLLHDLPFAITATVGKKRTDASYYLDTVTEVELLLTSIARTLGEA